MAPTAENYSIQFGFWPPQLCQHLHPLYVTQVAKRIHYLQICTGTNIYTCEIGTGYWIRATSTNKWLHHFVHHVSKNVSPLACCNFDAHEWILIYFGRNVTDKVGNQKTLYHATSSSLCFCTTWQNAEARRSLISLSWIVLHTQCTSALSSWKKNLSSVMCLIASNILPQKFSPSHGGLWAPSNTWFPGPTQVLNPKGSSIGAAVFAGLTSVTDRPTDHATPSVRIGRIYVRSTVMRPNNNYL